MFHRETKKSILDYLSRMIERRNSEIFLRVGRIVAKPMGLAL
jgi:hypothetical protein